MFILSSVAITTITSIQINEIRESQNLASLKTEKTHGYDKLKQRLTIIKKSPSFGFENIIADGVFLSFLQYFSDAQTEIEINKDLSPDFFDAILSLDPFYRDYYLFLAGSTTLYAGEPEKTVELMSEGLSKIDPNNAPDEAFYIWRYKAVEELLFLGNGEAARDSFTSAANWAAHSDSEHSALMEELSRSTAKFLEKDPDSLFAQIAAWNSIVASALNEDIRKKAAHRVEELTAIMQEQSNAQIHNTGIKKRDTVEAEGNR